jgi:hypothetical protein
VLRTVMFCLGVSGIAGLQGTPALRRHDPATGGGGHPA